MNLHKRAAFVCMGLILSTITTTHADPAPVPARIPRPQFQGDYFGEMARAFCTIKEVDLKGSTLLVKHDGGGAEVRVPIRPDTELRFRDSWGELSDYFPGQHVMLFVYVDENRKWTYPRAVQDEIQVSAAHGWYAAVTAIDLQQHTYVTRREEKNKDGAVTKVVEKQFSFDPAAKVWKGKTPGTIAELKIGDEVIQQLVLQNGKLVAAEILDRQGDAAVRAVQEEKHRRDQDQVGLPAYVNDLEVIGGSLTISVAWSGSDRAAKLQPGEVVTITPADGTPALAGAVVTNEAVDSRRRLTLAINARVAARLAIGQSLRVFVPGTGAPPPTGNAGVPETAWGK